MRLEGALGKKQVWRPHVRIRGLSEENVLYWRKSLWHVGTFRPPPQSFGAHAVIWRPLSDSAPGELCPPCNTSSKRCIYLRNKVAAVKNSICAKKVGINFKVYPGNLSTKKNAELFSSHSVVRLCILLDYGHQPLEREICIWNYTIFWSLTAHTIIPILLTAHVPFNLCEWRLYNATTDENKLALTRSGTQQNYEDDLLTTKN